MIKNFKSRMLNLSLLVSIATPWTTSAEMLINHAESGSMKDHVTQLERISNAHSQLLTQLQQQLTDNQRDVDSLRGQIEENQHQLSQIVERQKDIYKTIDSLCMQMPDVSMHRQTQIFTATGRPQNKAPVTTATISTLDADDAYNEAVELVLRKKQNEQAIKAFQHFVKRYSNSIYQPNANYWLGQLNYSQGNKDDAAYYFALVVKSYSQSQKAPDALLKVGLIMQEKGQNDKARAIYQQVEKLYPSAEAAKKAQKQLARLS